VPPEDVAAKTDTPLKLGIQAAEKGEVDRALALFEQAAKAKPDHPAAYLRAAALLRDLNRLDEAEGKYNSVLAIAPANVPALLGIAHIARKRNNVDAALNHLQTALKIDPENTKILMQIGNLFRDESRSAEAGAVYERVLEKDPSNAKAKMFLGQLARTRGELDTAIVHFRAALAQDAKLPRAASALAEALRESGLPEEESEEAPSGPRAVKTKTLLRSAREARKNGDEAAACAFLRAAAQAKPDNVEILANLGASLRRSGRKEEAATVFQDVLSRDPQHKQANLVLARHAREHRDNNTALVRLKAAAASDPGDLQIRLQIAEALVTLNRQEEADAVCKAVLRESPKDRQVLTTLGIIARKSSNWTAALSYFEAAAAADPSNLKARIQVGQAYCDLLNLDEAEKTFNRVLDADPESVDAIIGLGEAERLRGNPAEALKHFEAARKLAPTNLRAKAAIHSLKVAEGDFDWRTEIEDAAAIVRDTHATAGARLTAATILVGHGITEIVSPMLAELQAESPAARQLILAVREIERMGLAQPLSESGTISDSGDNQLDALQGFHEKPVAGSDTLLIVFSGRNNRTWMTISLLHRILRKTGASIVYVRDLQGSWYTQGIVGLGNDYASTTEAFRNLATRYGARRILTLGNCVGSLGALRYGLSLGAEGVLGIAPNVRPAGDWKPEYAARVEALRRQLPAGHKDMHTQYIEAAARPDVALIYGEQCEPDASDAKFMADVRGVTITGIPEATSHDSVKDLLIRGLLEPVLREFVADGSVSAETLKRLVASRNP
jgi:tetratricopeptide (TPR) repeat protein